MEIPDTEFINLEKFHVGEVQKFGEWTALGVSWLNEVFSVFTELFEIGVSGKVLFFYGQNSEGSFVGARVVEKSMEKEVEKSHLQGFPIGPMGLPIDYRFNGRLSTRHEMSPKWCQSKGG